MKGKQILEVLDRRTSVFVTIDSLFMPLKVKVDRDDLRDEIIYTCQGNMEIECGVRLVPHKGGAFELLAEDDKLLPKTA